MSDISSVVPVFGMNGSNGIGMGVRPLDVNPLAGPGTDFKAVALGGGANLEALPTYFADPLLQTGNLPGLALSAFNNRALRQGTFVVSSLCQWMSGQINQYIPDDGSQIGWISEWQSALGSFVTALIPPAPNLGAYLPLAGGTMVGHIRFQSGVSVILANNTWYYALDTGGTSRGLILKGSDNNVYVNDGSAGYVFIQGEPTANNNFFWCGRDTAGAVRGVVGLLSDNQIHLGDNARAIYFDCGGASAWCSSNIVIPNNYYYYCKATDGSNRAVLGINSGNSLLIGGSAPADTNIYGNPIYMRNNTYALGILQVNGFAYLQGGARSYIPGGNDPHQIYADYGYYARHHYTVGGLRDWICGCLNSGVFAIADETAAAIRFQIDTGGTVSMYNACSVGGGLTVYNGLNVASGTLTCGLLNCNAGMNVSGSLSVWSGGLYVASGDLTVNANINVGGSVNSSYFYSSGNIIADNTVQAGYLHSTGDIRADHDITSGNQIVSNYFYSYGGSQVNGSLTVNQNAAIGGNLNVGTVSIGGGLGVGGGVNINGGLGVGGGAAFSNNLVVAGQLTGGNITAGNQVVANYFYSYGSGQFNGSLSVGSNVVVGWQLNVGGPAGFANDCSVAGNFSCNNITINGNIGSGGTTGIAGDLTVDGNIGANHGTYGGHMAIGLTLYVSGQGQVAGTFYCNNLVQTSDDRMKSGVALLVANDLLDGVRALRPVSYVLRDSEQRVFGFLASDVAETPLRGAVYHNERDDLDYVSYSHLLTAAIGAIQRLEARLMVLEGR